MSASSGQPCSSGSAFHDLETRLVAQKALSTENMCMLLKAIGTNMLTLQPSQLSPQIQAFMTTSTILLLAVHSYDLLRYFIPS